MATIHFSIASVWCACIFQLQACGVHDDIVIAKSGSIGKTWVVDHLDPNWPCVFSGSLFRLRLKPCIPVEPNYLKLYFQSQLFERHILIWAHGSLTRNIGSDDIAELPLSLPPLGEQRRGFGV